MAAGTLVITSQQIASDIRRLARKYTLAWTSSAGGAVNGNLTTFLSGEIARVVFTPGAGGTQPTDLYDIVILDLTGMDILAGQGANLSQTNTTHVKPGVPFKDGVTTTTAPMVIDDTLELQVTNAGNAKTGTVIIYMR